MEAGKCLVLVVGKAPAAQLCWRLNRLTMSWESYPTPTILNSNGLHPSGWDFVCIVVRLFGPKVISSSSNAVCCVHKE